MTSDFAAPCKANKCTVLTSSRRLPKKVRAWLQNSDAQQRVITNRTLKRSRVGLWNSDRICRYWRSSAPEGLQFTSGMNAMLEKSSLLFRTGRSFQFICRCLFVCCLLRSIGVRLSTGLLSAATDGNGDVQPLRSCQCDCLDACAKGARVIEMACGTGKTRVIKELVLNATGRAPDWFKNILGPYFLGAFFGQLSIQKCSSNHPCGCCKMMQDAFAANFCIHPPSFRHCSQFRSFGSYLVIVVCLYLV